MKKNSLNKFLASNLILAVIYSLLGIAGLKLAIPPGHATAIFPAAGVSFVVILFGGVHLLPGVWLGSVSITLWGAFENESLNSSSFLIATAIALGSSLQAWLGAFLVHKIAKIDWQSLSQWTDIIWFLLLAGPIACLVSASWGITTLLVFDIIPISAMHAQWLNWWLGDMTGVILFAPISLIILLRQHALWRNRLIFIAIPTTIATLTVVIAFIYVSNSENIQANNKLQQTGISIANRITGKINTYQNAVHSVADFIRVTPGIKYAEFANFTQPLFARHPSLHGLSWNPYISATDKDRFEVELAKQFNLPNLHISQLDQSGQRVAAQDSPWYVPVAYISPLVKNSKAIAFDISSNPLRLAAINKATMTGAAAVTAPLKLVQESGSSISVLLLVPVEIISAEKNKPESTMPAGFAVGVFRIAEMLDSLIGQHLPAGLSVVLKDKNTVSSEQLLYSSANTVSPPTTEYIWQTDIVFAGRTWQLSTYATSEYISIQQPLFALKILFAGLMLTGFLQILLFVITGRNHSNLQTIQQQNLNIKEAEERWKLALEGARDGVWDWNVVSNDVVFSARYKEILGYAETEMGNSLDEWKKRIHPNDQEHVYANLNKYFQHEISNYENEHRMLCKDGSYCWVLARGKVVAWTEDNNPIRMIGTHTDISERKQAEQLQQNNETQFRNLFENAAISIWNEDMSAVLTALEQLRQQGVTDLQQYLQEHLETAMDIAAKVRVFQVNTATLKLFAAKAEDELLYQIHNTFGPNSMQVFISELCAIWEGQSIFRSEVELRSLDGKDIFAIISFHIPKTTEGFKSIPISIIDITDRKMAEDQLKLSAKVFSETNEGIIITDSQGTIVDVNPAFCKITSYSRTEAIGKNLRFLSSGKQSPGFYTLMWQALKEFGYWQGEVWSRKKEGELYAELLSISSILDNNGKVLHYVGIFTDITQSKKQQESLEQMAHYDVLTHLPNRALLADRFIQALAHSKRTNSLLAICFLDLDNFKPINDTYGHEAGDQLLIDVAKRIKTNLRDEDTVSRQGGDEFVLLLGNIDSVSHCKQMLARITESLAQPYVISDQSLSVSASIGVSLYPTDNADLDTLIRHADQAMYQAKLAGRNRYHLFNAQQDLLNIQKNIQLKEIQKALLNNELCLYYQPKVNMATGKIFGAEALIRWNHPEKGLIPPLKFLPIIEATELEIQVGHWVINEALQQLAQWQTQGIVLEVSVNVSSFHLQSSTFITELEKNLAKYPSVSSQYLQLEILESSALSNLQSINSIVNTCINMLGVNIALDDFGTGYSSLTHLRNLAAKTIKIDQTFVRDLLDDPNDHAIIDGIIGLANPFNREVIAEGVETDEHGLILLIMGCTQAQGYGIARPMPATDIQQWLAEYTPNQIWLSCAQKTHTLKADKLKLFRLTLAQWQKHFASTIQSSPEDMHQWPILKRTKCHAGIWIKRAKQEKLFTESWLNTLETAHNAMHDIAGELVAQYQRDEFNNAKQGLKDFHIAITNINKILEQCE
ncbi:MAG: EAL domain-containing protein [Methyloprofundus sp.]|nr:EAL domain-containing protein [Methyloprofundus sp.]